jgi:hypothetical protein
MGAGYPAPMQDHKSFLVLFFKKEPLALYSPTQSITAFTAEGKELDCFAALAMTRE